MRLPSGPFYLLSRDAGPGQWEYLTLDLAGRAAAAFFTAAGAAEAYRAARPGEGWEVVGVERAGLLELLAAGFRRGVFDAAADPDPAGSAQAVPIPRVLLDSE